MGRGRLGAIGLGGLPGMAWMRMGDWVLLGPGCIRQAQDRLDAGMAGGDEGWVVHPGWVVGRGSTGDSGPVPLGAAGGGLFDKFGAGYGIYLISRGQVGERVEVDFRGRRRPQMLRGEVDGRRRGFERHGRRSMHFAERRRVCSAAVCRPGYPRPLAGRGIERRVARRQARQATGRPWKRQCPRHLRHPRHAIRRIRVARWACLYRRHPPRECRARRLAVHRSRPVDGGLRGWIRMMPRQGRLWEPR